MTVTRRRPRSIDIATQLEQDILSGVLAAGTHLDEIPLADRFRVSRTPIRDALRQLEGSGLVELRPRQGAFVASLTMEKLIELFEIMASLEGLCARLAARRAGAQQIARMQAIEDDLVRMTATGDSDAYYLRNRDFHEQIYTAAANHSLEEMTRNIRNRVDPYRRHQLRRPGRLAESASEHQQVLDAIRTGNQDAAETLMRAHITVQGDALSDIIAALPRKRMPA